MSDFLPELPPDPFLLPPLPPLLLPLFPFFPCEDALFPLRLLYFALFFLFPPLLFLLPWRIRYVDFLLSPSHFVGGGIVTSGVGFWCYKNHSGFWFAHTSRVIYKAIRPLWGFRARCCLQTSFSFKTSSLSHPLFVRGCSKASLITVCCLRFVIVSSSSCSLSPLPPFPSPSTRTSPVISCSHVIFPLPSFAAWYSHCDSSSLLCSNDFTPLIIGEIAPSGLISLAYLPSHRLLVLLFLAAPVGIALFHLRIQTGALQFTSHHCLNCFHR